MAEVIVTFGFLFMWIRAALRHDMPAFAAVTIIALVLGLSTQG